MINERVKWTSVFGETIIDTANPNMDGTGSFGTVISGSYNGTLVRSITIKATGNTSLGMVRLFVRDTVFHGAKALIAEIKIPYVVKSSIDESFSVTLYLNYFLANSFAIDATTENSEIFVVTADGLDWVY